MCVCSAAHDQSHRYSGLSVFAGAEDVADLACRAVCGVELSAAIEELGEFGFERGQVAAPFPNFDKFGFE